MSMRMKFLVGALLVFGLSGNAAQADNNCISIPGTFSTSIGATTSCANYGMQGCTIGSGETQCSFPISGSGDCSFTATVGEGVGNSSDESTTFSVSVNGVAGNCRPRVAITQGNQGASYCAYLYPDGIPDNTDNQLITESRQGSGKSIAHKQLEICTDQLVVAPTLPPPVMSLQKKVVRADIPVPAPGVGVLPPNCFDDMGGFSDEAADVIDVIAPTEVAFCYRIENTGQGPATDILLTDNLIGLNLSLGSLPVNSDPIEVASDKVLLSTACGSQTGCIEVFGNDQVVNTADVSASFDGACPNCADSDTATINVDVTCDEITQGQASSSDAVVETRSIQGTSRCGPKTNNPDTDFSSVGLLCDGSCDLRPECDPALGGDPAQCAQPCKASGNWTFGVNNIADGSISACQSRKPTPGKLPLCQEVLTNPANNGSSDCSGIKNPALIRSDGHASEFGRNPYLYYFPSSGGGNSIGTIYCITYPGENPSLVCPTGSIVY